MTSTQGRSRRRHRRIRPASAQQPPAPWQQTATASLCWLVGSIASARSLTNWATAPSPIEADVTDRGSIVAAADRVRQELGNADVLVNNAGVMLLGPFDSASVTTTGR